MSIGTLSLSESKDMGELTQQLNKILKKIQMEFGKTATPVVVAQTNGSSAFSTPPFPTTAPTAPGTVSAGTGVHVTTAASSGNAATVAIGQAVETTSAPEFVAIKLTPTAFASLPAVPVEGMIAEVNDSNTVVWGAVIGGGAGNKVLAHYNGVNWTVAGV